MLFNKVRLSGLTTIDLPMSNGLALATDQFILKGVDGLGPPPVAVSIANWLGQGGVYQGRRPENREVIVKIGLNPNYAGGQSVSDLRAILYGLMTPGQYDMPNNILDATQIQLINNSTFVAGTAGYVKNFDINPFSKDPEVVITFACPSAYLSGTEVVASGGNSLTYTNAGTAPTGFFLDITMNASTSSWSFWTVQNPVPIMLFTYPFVSGDRLMVDTRMGQRSVTIDPASGPAFNAINTLSSTSTWIQLLGGVNAWNRGPTTFVVNSFRYTPLFWGI